jgi:lysophospholipase L1-like esterase
MQRQGWFETWEYTTRGDRRLGFRLRAGVANGFSGVPVHVNADGLRAADSTSHVGAKAAGETLVVVAGDSTTFGVHTPYQQTYSVLLEQHLRSLGRAARVVNLGVPGYSLEQTVASLEAWEHLAPDLLIVTVNGLNDRVFVGRPDSPEMLARDYKILRPYELGDLISYPVLYWYKVSHGQAGPPAIPDLSRGIPSPRVPLERYRFLLEQLIRTAKERGTRLVLVATGDPLDASLSESGLAAVQAGRWDEALASFEKMRAARPTLFLPAFYAYQSALKLGRLDAASAIRREYEAAYRALPDPYITQFSYFASEYTPILQSVVAQSQVPLVDLQAQFQRSNYFLELGHFGPLGHAAVAAALAPLVDNVLASSAR